MEGIESRAAVNKLIATCMPGVARIVREHRERDGDAHVTECVRRGLAGESGWFYAREGALAVGVPWGNDPDVLQLLGYHLAGVGQAFVMMRPKEAQRGQD